MDAPSRNAAAALSAASALTDASEEMACEGGLYARLFRQGYRFSFFQAVRLAEQLFPHAAPLGETSDVAAERLRLRPSRAQVFPAADLRRVERVGAGDDALTAQAHVRITATFLGLYGVDAPLPTAYTEPMALVGEDGKPSALRHFLDLFSHRLYAFFYRSWKKHRPLLGAHQSGAHGPALPDLHARRFLALAGLGTPGVLAQSAPQGLTPRASVPAVGAGGMQLGKTRLGQEVPSPGRPAASTERAAAGEEARAPALPPMRLAAFAGLLARRTRSAEGLRALLSGFFEGLPVRIVENVPRWIPLRNRPRMGGGDEGTAARLGANACIGARVYDRSTKFRIELGPMRMETFRALLPGQEKARQLQALVRLYVPDGLAYEVKLTLRPEAAQHARLGGMNAQLGHLAVLGRAPSQMPARIVEYE